MVKSYYLSSIHFLHIALRIMCIHWTGTSEVRFKQDADPRPVSIRKGSNAVQQRGHSSYAVQSLL